MPKLKGYRRIPVNRTTEQRLLGIKNRLIKENPEKYNGNEPSLHKVIIWMLDELQRRV